MSAQTRTEIQRLLAEHGLHPNQKLGQHFLADGNLTRKIVITAGASAGDLVVEVGAGTGTLTSALAGAGATVVSYEVDERLRPVLESVTAGLEVDLRFEDAMTVDMDTALEGSPWTMVANLPYNVGTPLVLDALRRAPRITRFVVMMQREVAERLVAPPGSSQYGLPSVVTQIHAVGEVAFRVAPQVFVPPPRVESAVVVLDRRDAPPEAERAIELARMGFGQRRKMLRKSLSTILDDPAAALERASIDPAARAEAIAPADYLRLARLVP